MSPRPAGKLSPEAVIAMLDDPDFCDESRSVIAEAKVLYEQATSSDESKEKIIARAQSFRGRWGVWPPQTGELLDPDPRRRVVEAIASGNWGIVLVFPWTTDREIYACIKKIRSTISKWHKDSLNFYTAQLEGWLEECGAGFGRKAIVRAVRRRTKALRRPTTSQAFARADRETPGLADELFEAAFVPAAHQLEHNAHPCGACKFQRVAQREHEADVGAQIALGSARSEPQHIAGRLQHVLGADSVIQGIFCRVTRHEASWPL